jgi:DNA modification methylase
MIHCGDALTVLRALPDTSVNCCITSPPYYGLRDYGCAGQIGLESTPAEYIARLVDVFREVRRVLRDDGTIWINVGDSYNAAGRNGHGTREGCKQGTNRASADGSDHSRPSVADLKPKDLIGIPWMLAFALRDDGWYLRQDIIWHKPNPMPESVKDRCTKAHEYVFMLSKSQKYWFDADAIAEESAANQVAHNVRYAREYEAHTANVALGSSQPGNVGNVGIHARARTDGKRNKRSVWTMATRPTPEAHFATFPIELPETCLRAGCPEGGTVLDPFAGAGTTGLACLKNGRNFVGIELNAEYVRIAEDRARKYQPLFCEAAL